LEIEHLGCP